MSPRGWAAGLASLGLMTAVACSGEDELPKAVSDAAVEEAGASPDGAVNPPDAAEPDDATTDSGLDAGADAMPEDAGPPPPTTCGNASTIAATATTLLELGAMDVAFVTLAEDGLSLAWVESDEADVRVHVADRPALDQSFLTPVTIDGDFAVERAALSSDGLRLVMVAADHKRFLSFVRESRDAAFAESTDNLFANLNDPEISGLGAAEEYADPVITRGDRYFLFSRHGNDPETVRLASRVFAFDPFSLGVSLSSSAQLTAVGEARRLPITLTEDGLTLFYFDTLDSTAKLARRGADGEFQQIVPLGARLDVQPTPGCTSVIYRDLAEPTRVKLAAFQ